MTSNKIKGIDMKIFSSFISLSFLVLFLLVFSLPSICFSELKTVEGEYCGDYLGDMKNNKELNEFRRDVRWNTVSSCIEKITGQLENSFSLECRVRVSTLFKNVEEVSHTENDRKICDKIKITSDHELIKKYLNQEKCKIGNDSTDWVEYGWDDDGNTHFYKKGSIDKEGGKYIVQVWNKDFIPPKMKDDFIKKCKKDGLSTEGWDKQSYTISLSEYDCKKLMRKELYYIIYDTSGKTLLKSENNDKQEWEYIIPDSNGDTLRKKVCK